MPPAKHSSAPITGDWRERQPNSHEVLPRPVADAHREGPSRAGEVAQQSEEVRQTHLTGPLAVVSSQHTDHLSSSA